MAKLIALAMAAQPDQMIWVHPDAVERLRSNGAGNTVLYFRSGETATVGGDPDFVAAKLNSASV